MLYRELKLYLHKRKRQKAVAKRTIAFMEKVTSIQKKEKMRKNCSLDSPIS